MPHECLSDTGQTCADTKMCESVEGTTWTQLTLFVEGFPARMLASLESGRGWKGGGQPSGASLPASLARLDPDGCWRKMCQGYYQVTLDGSLEMFCATWPRAGMMRNGTAYRLAPSVHLTAVIESSLWDTPSVAGAHPGALNRKGRQKHLQAQVYNKMWPTPTGSDSLRHEMDMIRHASLGAAVCRAQKSGGQLNPTWVEWLMGFPLGWTDLDASATP